MRAAPLRRAGFLATLAAGFLMLGAAVHGIVDVDRTLKVASARTAPPASTPSQRFDDRETRGWEIRRDVPRRHRGDCERRRAREI